jgi:hypothetical protein
MQLSKIKQDFVGIFDTNNDTYVEIYELYPLFLVFAVLLFFFIVIRNLNILVIFKQSKLFIVLFALLIIYSILKILDYNNTYNKKNKPSLDNNFYYVLTIFLLLFSIFSLIYLFGLFL